jgi:3-deoxy-D-manno-octulosonic-acid transferase
MVNLFDIAYGMGVGLASPYWLIKKSARRKVLGAFSQRMGKITPRDPSAPAVMIHAVSLGEINATRALVSLLHEQRPDVHFVISTTTQTGYESGQKHCGQMPYVTLIRYPLDFSAAVLRVIDAVRPDLVVLMELEVWPNFVRICQRRKIPVMLANGRLTTHSFRRYRLIRPIARWMFSRLNLVCAQDETYALRFVQLGVPSKRIRVTGTMKFDNARVADRVEGAQEIASAMGLKLGREAIWVCGSTGPGEEEIILREYRALLATFSRLRLVIVPRKPERFDDVAELIAQFRFKALRRSTGETPPLDPPVPPVILGDTMGELRKFYSLADIVFVGRTLVDLGARQHGSDMIEPAALAKPIIVGPHTANFAEAMRKFRQADAILEVTDGAALAESVRVLVSTPAEATAMGQRAQAVVQREQGSTSRHAQLVLQQMNHH